MAFHPVMYTLVRAQARKALVAQGVDLGTAIQAVRDASNDLIDHAAQGITVPPELQTGLKMAGGTIIQAVLSFLESAAGQQLIAALLALLGL